MHVIGASTIFLWRKEVVSMIKLFGCNKAKIKFLSKNIVIADKAEVAIDSISRAKLKIWS